MANEQNNLRSSRTSQKVKRRRTDKIATWLQGATALAAIAALVISLLSFQRELNRKASKEEVALIQMQRYNSSVDACTILNKVIRATFVGHQGRATMIIKKAGIEDCQAYARSTVQPVTTDGGTR
jgi:uncharacterized membrane-anchored protein YitT (DUF2179 family)